MSAPAVKEGINQPLARSFTMRVEDIERRNGVVLLNESDVLPEDPLIRGLSYNKKFRQGLSLTCRDTVEEHPFVVQSKHDAGLSCIFFLKGHVDVRIGMQDFSVHAEDMDVGASVLGVFHPDDEPFRRKIHQAQSVRHLVLNASPEWLAENGFDDVLKKHSKLELARDNLAFRQWTAGHRLNQSIREFFSPSVLVPELLDLHLEARSLDLVSETLSAFFHGQQQTTASTLLNRHDQIRLQRAKELIFSASGQALSVDFIAQQAGISTSGLQRLFRRAEACSVFEYVRQRRMEQAFDLLSSSSMSVKEVSVQAGYNSPANFATAFKRQFGVSPTQIAST